MLVLVISLIVGAGCLVAFLLRRKYQLRLAAVEANAEKLVKDVREFLVKRNKDWDESGVLIMHVERLRVLRHGRGFYLFGCVTLIVEPNFELPSKESVGRNVHYALQQFTEKQWMCIVRIRTKGYELPEEAMLCTFVYNADGNGTPAVVPLALGIRFRNIMDIIGAGGDPDVREMIDVREALRDFVFFPAFFGDKAEQRILEYSFGAAVAGARKEIL